MLAIQIFNFVFVTSIAGVFVAMLAGFGQAFAQDAQLRNLGYALLAILGAPAVLFILVALQNILLTLAVFLSYIKVSPYGMEYSLWIFKRLRCTWADTARLQRLWLTQDAVWLHQAEVLGPSFYLKRPFNWLSPAQHFIPLRGFQGWPEGALAADLRRYAPHLFEAQAVQPAQAARPAQAAQPAAQVAGYSPDQRNLAWLCHASILFFPVGLVVCALVWAAQHQKSPFVERHLYQAALWQALMAVLNLLSVCLLSVGLLAILLGLNGSEASLSPAGLLGALALGVLFMLLFAGNLVMIGIGLRGAWAAYNGQEFRYWGKKTLTTPTR
jgi:uncharacterized Tic20 family protein